MKRGFKLFGIIAISVLVVLGITSCNHDFESVNMIIINNSTVHTITGLQHGKMVAGKFHVDCVYPKDIKPGERENSSMGPFSRKAFGVLVDNNKDFSYGAFATASLGASVRVRDGDTIIITLGSNDKLTVKKR